MDEPGTEPIVEVRAMTDKIQLEIALFFTELGGCKSALKVCCDLFAMEQTPLLKRIRDALKSDKRELALMLMKYWLEQHTDNTVPTCVV